MKVFITGGAGFIGSHLADAYLAQGDQVSILDNLSTGSLVNIEHIKNRIQINKGDIRDQKRVETLIEQADLVLHMAAAVGVHTILKNPIQSISTNFAGSEIVLNAALKYDKRIIIASTSEIYGKNESSSLSEDDDRIIGSPQKLRWSYADAKALEEAMAHALFLASNLRVTTIRFFNTVGPRQSGQYGMVIPRFIKAAINNQPLEVYGDGQQTRVFCHIYDTLKAILDLAASNLTIGEVFNVGGVEEISIYNLAEKIIKVLNAKSTIKLIPYNKAYDIGFEDMRKRVPNIDKISKFIKWVPQRNLNNIITDIAKNISIET